MLEARRRGAERRGSDATGVSSLTRCLPWSAASGAWARSAIVIFVAEEPAASVTTALGAVFGGFAPLTRVAPSKPVSTTLERLGSFTSIASSERLSRVRSSRATSSFDDVRTFMTMRMTIASSEIDSRPQISGFSRTRERHLPDWRHLDRRAQHLGLDGVDVGVVRHGEVEDDARPALRHVADAQDLAVAHEPERAVHVAHLGDADLHLLDDAGRRAEVDDVADAELVLDDHEEAVQHVLHDVLRAEAEAGADRGGEQRERAEDRRGR